MLYYWKDVVGIRGEKAPRTTLELASESVRQAWRICADRPGTRMSEAVMMAWRTWLAREGVDGDDVLKGLAGYAQAMASILHGFESGKVRKADRSEEHTSELQSRLHLVCRLLLEKKN